MKVEEILKTDWQTILYKQKYVSFFECPEWYTLWENYFNAKTTTYLLDDHLLLSTIQLKGSKGLIKFNNSSPAGTYSNFRSMNGPFEMEGDDFKKIQRTTGVNFLRMSPFSNITIKGHVFFSIKNDFTQVINLTTLDRVKQDWSRNHNRLYQKSLEASLSVSTTNHRQDWNDYVSLYKNFVRTKGSEASSSYHEKLFDGIFDLDKTQRDLWIVKRENKLIAGRLVFYTKDYAVEWHANSLPEANALGANQLLIHAILSDAKSRGISIYDFNPSAGHDGVVAFKDKFGAKRKESLVYQKYNKAQQIYLRLKKNHI